MGQYYKPMSIDKKQWVYSHDYGNGLKLMEHSYLDNNFVAVVEKLLSKGGGWYKHRIVWAGDYADWEKGRKENLYYIIGTAENRIQPEKSEGDTGQFLVNHTLKVFIDMQKIDAVDAYGHDFHIHPLPILTCEGNGRGGGDFRGEDEAVGIWARHPISVEIGPPKDYKEVDGNFREARR